MGSMPAASLGEHAVFVGLWSAWKPPSGFHQLELISMQAPKGMPWLLWQARGSVQASTQLAAAAHAVVALPACGQSPSLAITRAGDLSAGRTADLRAVQPAGLAMIKGCAEVRVATRLVEPPALPCRL